jgi:dolichol-phosphate mannosyltransferase
LTNDATIVRLPWAKVSRVAKFGIVGVGGILINTGVLYLLGRRLGLPLVLASGVAAELAVISNFLLNSSWTFATRPSLPRFAKFNVASLAGLSVNVMGVLLLTRLGLYLLAANLIGIAVGFAVNYLFSVGWVWGRAAR